ncbi:MAG: HAMP domain-containing protein [Anaerolineales bacterium]|nr:HAMP domain-containing protein [Chloroflexota bacterium]MBL6981247.1 HAMP domain-containing protein [Anaerolineales bacterium]
MSLRVRLTLLYTSLVGGILLLFGIVVYQLVSINLVDQIDDLLARTASDLVDSMRLNAVGELDMELAPDLELATNVYVQLWERNTGLRFASASISHLREPLDPLDQLPAEPVYRATKVGETDLRVLSVPLSLGNRLVGTLQVGASLAIVEATQRTLLTVLAIGTVASMGLAAMAVSLTTYQALSSLERVTNVALQITRADDLSRRIPYQGPPEDEIGQLIQAFNQTLGRLENLFNAQRRFVADVGHELRTPLTVIKGNVNLMRRLGCGDEESLGSIDSEVDRLTRMIGDLLLLARVESGKLPLDTQIVEMDTLVLEVLQQTSVLAEDRLQVQLGEIDQVLVCGDRDRLKQVLLNLVENAIKYTPEGGEVVVDLGKSENQARIVISDTGPGIPAEDLPHIFERFYRAEKSRTRTKDGKGFGLGLSIAYWIVRNHDGQIEVQSEIGEGTTFSVWLPLAEGEADCQPEV